MKLVKGTNPFTRNLRVSAIVSSTVQYSQNISSLRQNLKENSHPLLESTRTPDTNLP